MTSLAARLCSEAKGGQILTNQKTLARAEESVQVEPLGEVTFEGISQPVPMFNITGFSAPPTPSPFSNLRLVETRLPR